VRTVGLKALLKITMGKVMLIPSILITENII